MRSRNRAWCRGEHGSLPLAFLVAIIVGGIVVVLVARIVATQNLVRFDEAFHGSLQTADAGVNLGKFWLNNDRMLLAEACVDDTGSPFTPPGFPGPYPPSEFPVGCTTPEETREIAGSPYTLWLTRISDREWDVASRGMGTSALGTEVERLAVGTMAERPLVETALFAESLINFSGNNSADSYSSDLMNIPTDESWCRGNGFIATNGLADLSGVAGSDCHSGWSRTVDRVMLHDWKESPATAGISDTYPGGNRCEHAGGGGGANCRTVSESDPTYLEPDLLDDPLEYGTTDNVAFIQAAIDACKADGQMITGTYATGSGIGTNDRLNPRVLQTATYDAGGSIDFPGDVDGPFHCFESLFFDAGNTKIGPIDGQPVILVVDGTVRLKGQGGGPGGPAHVGCEDDDGDAVQCVAGDPTGIGASRPDASRLWIFTNGDIDLGGNSAFAGVMWGPTSNCFAGAQGNVFGSLICGTLPSNLGGWKFHYDEALFDISSGDFFQREWREEILD